MQTHLCTVKNHIKVIFFQETSHGKPEQQFQDTILPKLTWKLYKPRVTSINQSFWLYPRVNGVMRAQWGKLFWLPGYTHAQKSKTGTRPKNIQNPDKSPKTNKKSPPHPKGKVYTCAHRGILGIFHSFFTHTYICVHIHTHIYTYIYTHIHIYTHMHIQRDFRHFSFIFR